MLDSREQEIIWFIKQKQGCSSTEVYENFADSISFATVKRLLVKLVEKKLLAKIGNGRSTKYSLSSSYEVLYPVDVELYFQKEIDERIINHTFNHQLISPVLASCELFTQDELSRLNDLQEQFQNNLRLLSLSERKIEFERLAIDLSWKSSQIEGNTYSLLETERLLKDKETASGKTKEEAVMLLNHKEAIDFISENPDYLIPLSVAKVENIHYLLIKELGIDKNLRRRRVGITGTNYQPLDNEFQIKEALTSMCALINNKENPFEKALLALVLISYIQPFADGNKRTARIVSNAILMNHNYCPISFRSVDSIEYKKAMLIFYEQNNISAFKSIFIAQFEFAVNTYF